MGTRYMVTVMGTVAPCQRLTRTAPQVGAYMSTKDTTDFHYLWHLAGARYPTDTNVNIFANAGGNGWVDSYSYISGNGDSHLYIQSRILDTEVYTYGYTY